MEYTVQNRYSGLGKFEVLTAREWLQSMEPIMMDLKS